MKILENEKINKILIIVILMLALILGCVGSATANDVILNENTEENTKTEKTNNNEEQVTKTNDNEIKNLSVVYNTHIQDIGWEDEFSKKDGATAGTQGKSLRLEAIKIKLNENDSNIGIKYSTHIEDIGWQDFKYNGEMAGTEGKSLRLEAIKIELTNTEKYSVMYRTHVQDIGWQDWKYDGEIAGTEGKKLRLEAIEIKIVPKIKKAILRIEVPSNNDVFYNNDIIKVAGWRVANFSNNKIDIYIDNSKISDSNINYYSRNDMVIANPNYGTGKQNPTAGFNTLIEASKLSAGKHTIKINVVSPQNDVVEAYSTTIEVDKNIHVEYSAHVQDIGWQDYKRDAQTAGTEEKKLRVEAIKIKGINLPENVGISYQLHVQDIGWQDWKSNGEIAGTEGKSLRAEAIKIKLTGTEEYSIMYKAHVENVGWQEDDMWCYDGEMAGTVGEGLRLEAIQIKIVKKYDKMRNRINVDCPRNTVENKKKTISGWTMSNVKNTQIKIFIDNVEIENVKRIERQEVLNAIKGYGDETIFNLKPQFEAEIDFSKYNLGNHIIKVQIISEDGKVLSEQVNNFQVEKPITIQTGTYGISGLKVKGDSRGSDLKYYRFGDGPNVFFATYAIHGYEDLWAKDGNELVDMAEQLYTYLVNSHDNQIADKWTIYIFPGVNQDGLKYGSTNNGPGRTTLYSQAPGNKGIDLNRCWQVGSNYTIFKDNRNYNGTAGFQAYEAQFLRDFLLSHKSKNGQTMLVDLHGWTQQLIGDPDICSFYEKKFAENDKSAVGRYGDGYLINWARNSLGSTSKPAKTALIELPHQGINGHQSVIANRLPTRYLEATIDLLKNINV